MVCAIRLTCPYSLEINNKKKVSDCFFRRKEAFLEEPEQVGTCVLCSLPSEESRLGNLWVKSASSQAKSLREGSIHGCWEEVSLSIPPQEEQFLCAGSHAGSPGDRGMEERL